MIDKKLDTPEGNMDWDNARYVWAVYEERTDAHPDYNKVTIAGGRAMDIPSIRSSAVTAAAEYLYSFPGRFTGWGLQDIRDRIIYGYQEEDSLRGNTEHYRLGDDCSFVIVIKPQWDKDLNVS